MRVAVFFHRFGPYHCARLEAAARCCDLTAIEVAGETEEYAWSRVSADAHGYKRMTLFPTGNTRAMPPKRVYHAVDLALANAAPEVAAIPGWSDNAALIALSWAATHGIPAILMSESTALDQPRVSWREWIKRRIVDLYSSALVGGQRHVDYLVDLGMPRERIFTGYDVVDNEYFAQKTQEVRSQRSEVRKQYGLPINYFLASARFIPKKNLFALLRGYAEYRRRSEVRGQKSEKWHLVLLGDGPLKADLSRLISDLRLDDCVHLPGFKQYDELPVYYALANAFVHVSKSEQWGLVVNEALASGLPVIVSNRCGCVPELVRTGSNGFTFDPSNEHELADRLLQIASFSLEERSRLGKASRQIAANFSADRFGQGLVAAARMAIALGPAKASLLHKALLRALLRR